LTGATVTPGERKRRIFRQREKDKRVEKKNLVSRGTVR